MASTTATTSDADLLRHYRRTRDEEAFARVVSRHAAAVRAVALRSTGNAAAAEDVAQATFLVLVGRAGSAARSARLRGSAMPWLARTCRYCAANWRRSEARRRRREKLAAVPERTDPSQPGELQSQVAEALAALPKRDRRLIELRHLDGLAWPEVAAKLDLQPAAARVAGGRAMDRLRERLERRGVTVTSAALAAALSSLSAWAARSLVRPALPTSAAFGLARGTLVIMKAQSAALTVAALVALGGVGGTLLYAAQGEGEAPTNVASPPPAAEAEPAAEDNRLPQPLPASLAAFGGDGTEYRIVGLSDGETWWDATGRPIDALPVTIPPLDDQPPITPRGEGGGFGQYGDGFAEQPAEPEPVYLVLDVVGGTATEKVSPLRVVYGRNAAIREDKLEGGRRSLLRLLPPSEKPQSASQQMAEGMGQRRDGDDPADAAAADASREPLSLTISVAAKAFDATAKGRMDADGTIDLGSHLQYEFRRLRLPDGDGGSRLALQLTVMLPPVYDMRLRIGGAIVEPAGEPAYGDKFFRVQYPLPPEVEGKANDVVLEARNSETIFFGGLPAELGDEASPSVVVN